MIAKLKTLNILFFLLATRFVFGQDPNKYKVDSGTFYLTEYRYIDAQSHVFGKYDSCRFKSIKTIYRDSIVQIINSEKKHTEVFWNTQMRFTFHFADSSFYYNSRALKYLGVKTDTIHQISAFRYLIDFPNVADEETSIYFNPEMGVVSFLNYWWFYGKITYNSFKPELNTFDIYFHEYEDMLNYYKKD